MMSMVYADAQAFGLTDAIEGFGIADRYTDSDRQCHDGVSASCLMPSTVTCIVERNSEIAWRRSVPPCRRRQRRIGHLCVAPYACFLRRGKPGPRFA